MVYFVSGIDTGIGKSYATGMIARYLARQGRRVITQKLVQTGNEGFSEDIAVHRRVMGCGYLPEDHEGLTSPEIFKFPASPHLAAELEEREVDLEKIRRATLELAKRYDTVLLEGAGGLAVPLTKDLLTIDYAAREGYPVILVTSGRLGSISQTILALEALVRRNMALAGVVFNLADPADPVIARDAKKMIREAVRKLGRVPVLVEMGLYEADGATPDFSALF